MKQTSVLLITALNRKAKSQQCLHSIKSQERLLDNDVDNLIIDGGCKDGTQDTVKTEFPDVQITLHDGFYWAGNPAKYIKMYNE